LSKSKALADSFKQFGNPFKEHSGNLVSLESNVILGEDRVLSLRKVEQTGLECYQAFLKCFVRGTEINFFDPLKKNRTKIFAKQSVKPPKQVHTVASLKNDVSLFSKLFIACQHRNIDLENFFEYENQTYPPCLSVNGEMRSCTKSELASSLKSLVEVSNEVHSTNDVAVYDGSAVNILVPRKSRIFSEYCDEFFKEVKRDAEIKGASRVDLVFDLYNESGPKKIVQEKRGTGLRRMVSPSHALPKNWPDFLRNPLNKNDLFRLLGLASLKGTALAVVSHDGETFISTENASTNLHGRFSTSLTEADGRLILHLHDAVKAWIQKRGHTNGGY